MVAKSREEFIIGSLSHRAKGPGCGRNVFEKVAIKLTDRKIIFLIARSPRIDIITISQPEDHVWVPATNQRSDSALVLISAAIISHGSKSHSSRLRPGVWSRDGKQR